MAGLAIAEPDTRVQETQFSTLQDDFNREGQVYAAADAAINKRLDYGTAVGSASPPRPPDPPNLAPGSSSSPPPVPAPTGRVLAPDLLRGLLMVFQSIDHAAVMLAPWRHGTANESEGDGTAVDTWNHNRAWVVRMLTHLCAPGFMFLLGMGIVYFGRSRSKLQWSASRMAYHFVVRGLVLAAVNELLTLIIGRGQFIIVNIVLVALAVNYVLAGLLWIGLNISEHYLTRAIGALSSSGSGDDVDASQPLIDADPEGSRRNRSKMSSHAGAISWHLHNLVYFAAAAVTIWWNIWLSRNGGHCDVDTSSTPDIPTSENPWFDFWFYPMFAKLVMSAFPPLAWLSFALLGVLYGRIILSRSWSAITINLGNAIASVAFGLLFVATRLLHFGNLSEDCLRMPEQLAHPHHNQYLVSFKSFFYVVKYPPSVAFLAYTMSFNFLLLAFFGALPEKIARRIPTLMTFGTSALFFYVVHLVLYGALGGLVKGWFGQDLGYTDPITQKPARGVGDTPTFWITWLIGLAILYVLCIYFSKFKRAQGPDSVWRFF